MDFWDIASIVFVCTAVNHLGLVEAFEKAIHYRIPIVNCIKCLTFWAVFGYGCYDIATYKSNIFTVLAISFLSAWASIWLDLFMGIIDHLYMKVYDSLYPTTDETDSDALGASDTLPDVSAESCDEIAADGTNKA